jgi:hypothetical protein
MTAKLFLCFIIILLSSNARSNETGRYPFAAFAPVGYQVLDSVSGDLNGDRIRDIVVVYRAILESRDHEGLPRVTMILFGHKDGTYTLHARNDRIIECLGCGGMIQEPFERITIKGRFVSFEQTFGSANRALDVVTFKFDKRKKKMILHKHGSSQYNIYSPEDTHDEFFDQELYGKADFASYGELNSGE